MKHRQIHPAITSTSSFFINIWVSGQSEVSRKHLSRISVIGKNCSEESRAQMVNLLKNNKIYVLDGVVYDYQIDLLVASNQLIEAISFLHKYCGLDQ